MGVIFCFLWTVIVRTVQPTFSFADQKVAAGLTLNITDFGASQKVVAGLTLNIADFEARGDGRTDNTAIIQHQIDSCSQRGGGTVWVPAGRWLTGTLYMKSKVNLHLDNGAVLLGSTLLKDYPGNPPGNPGGSFNLAGGLASAAAEDRRGLLFAENAEHISITGNGTIDGQGGDSAFQKGDNGAGRPRLVFFSGCRDVRIQGITLRNAAFWTQYYSGCDGLVIRGIKVYSHSNWNNDGLDIDSRNVTVSDCTIDSDDDALCFKSEGTSACENITVSNCRLASNCNAIKMGTASVLGFKNITISHCVIHSAAEDNIRHWKTRLKFITADRTVLAGIALESVDGGEMNGITISHISMTDVQTPVFIRLGNRRRRPAATPSAGTPSIGIPSTGIPSAGRPEGTSSAGRRPGTPSVGTPSADRPAGISSANSFKAGAAGLSPSGAPDSVVSSLRNIRISHIRATAQSLIPCSITGIPGHAVENVFLDSVIITCPGGGTAEQGYNNVDEKEKDYPENRMFGNTLPASGMYARHVKGLSLHHIKFTMLQRDERPVFVLDDVKGVDMRDTGVVKPAAAQRRQVAITRPAGPSAVQRPPAAITGRSGTSATLRRPATTTRPPGASAEQRRLAGTGQPTLPAARFSTGDNMAWKESGFNDKSWPILQTGIPWEQQGYKGYDGYAWYRIHFKLPSSLITEARLKDSLRLNLSKIDDADEIYLNGIKIGKNGSFPGDPEGFITRYFAVREYHFWVKDPLLRWDRENVIAIRVYDGSGNGGITGAPPFVNMIDVIDGISLSPKMLYDNTCKIEVVNHSRIPVKGSLSVVVNDRTTGRSIDSMDQQLELPPLGKTANIIKVPADRRCTVTSFFTEARTGKVKSATLVASYILTPLPPAAPRINGAKSFGVRPDAPFLFKIPATGERPLFYSVKNLPSGLVVDANTGIITGALSKEGAYQMQFVVTNAQGKDERAFTIRVGDLLSLTPPMGWNSWNCWGLSVSEEKVRNSAQALIDKGLADHGWSYINVDDAWQAPKRAADGAITSNERFPDMKGLGDWLHGHGLKLGIYSSPGEQTCGRYLGSYGHEMQDAASYARWGVDYLKYDWCSYGKIAGNDTAKKTFVHPYRVMEQALQAQNRDILYSLCQYGMKDVWKWGREVGGNAWRTMGDITDSWESMSTIGFNQDKLYPYAGPGHWNDPDMLVLGQLGWGDPQPTRLTPDEQYTHMSLWCLLSAPLLIGGDLGQMDDFTLNLLTNDEVIALDQDALGRQAQRVIKTDTFQVWTKELEDGSQAIGIFNLTDTEQVISLKWASLQLANDQHQPGNYQLQPGNDQKVRDLWRQKDLGIFGEGWQTPIAPHGVRLIKITPVHNTLVPVVQNRDPLYNWQSRHAEVIALNKTAPPLNVLLGNSIIHFWGGKPQGPFSRGEDSWNEWLEPLGVRNMGFGWDKIENVLWRVQHGELDGYEAQHVIVLIGTNNLSGNTDAEIIAGLALLVKAVRQRQPHAEILLSGILPRRNMEGRIEKLNRQIDSLAGSQNLGKVARSLNTEKVTGSMNLQKVADSMGADTQAASLRYINPGKLLLAKNGKIDESLFGDGLHPNAAGYRKIAPELASYLKN